jgi:hypothetical protein
MDALRKEQRVLDLEWEDRAESWSRGKPKPPTCFLRDGGRKKPGLKGRGYGTNC